MKKNCLLADVENILDFLQILKSSEGQNALMESVYSDEVIEVALNGLSHYDSLQEVYFLNYLHYVDNKLTSKMEFTSTRKIMTILAGSIYIGNFYDKIKHYDLLHLMSLSFFSVFEPVREYENNLELFSEKIFESFQEKTKDFMFYPSFSELVRCLHDEGMNEDEITEYIESKTSSELLREAASRVEKQIEQGGFLI